MQISFEVFFQWFISQHVIIRWGIDLVPSTVDMNLLNISRTPHSLYIGVQSMSLFFLTMMNIVR